jgi:hypothetical protein
MTLVKKHCENNVSKFLSSFLNTKPGGMKN